MATESHRNIVERPFNLENVQEKEFLNLMKKANKKDLPELKAEEKYWVVVGLAVTRVIQLNLKTFVSKYVTEVYNLLQMDCSSEKYTDYLKKKFKGYRLQYRNINGNDKKAKVTYDNTINSPTDLAKLFLSPCMAKFTSFDDMCPSGLFKLSSVIMDSQIYSPKFSKLKELTDQMRVLRNEWAHANISMWTEEMVHDKFREMETFIEHMQSVLDIPPETFEILKKLRSEGMPSEMAEPVEELKKDPVFRESVIVSTRLNEMRQKLQINMRVEEVAANHEVLKAIDIKDGGNAADAELQMDDCKRERNIAEKLSHLLQDLSSLKSFLSNLNSLKKFLAVTEAKTLLPKEEFAKIVQAGDEEQQIEKLYQFMVNNTFEAEQLLQAFCNVQKEQYIKSKKTGTEIKERDDRFWTIISDSSIPNDTSSQPSSSLSNVETVPHETEKDLVCEVNGHLFSPPSQETISDHGLGASVCSSVEDHSHPVDDKSVSLDDGIDISLSQTNVDMAGTPNHKQKELTSKVPYQVDKDSYFHDENQTAVQSSKEINLDHPDNESIGTHQSQVTSGATQTSEKSGHLLDKATTPRQVMQVLNTLTSVAFGMIGSKKHTVYDFENFLRGKIKANNISIRTMKDEREATILHFAAEKNQSSFLRVIQRLGFWDHLRDLKMPNTSLQGQYADKDAREIAEFCTKSRKLLKEIDDMDKWEKSMNDLQKAARAGELKKVQDLIKKRPDQVHETDGMGCNALYWACANGDKDVVHALYKAGSKPDNINKKGESLLHIVCICGHSNLIQTIIKDFKVPVNIEDKAKRTAICYTADNGDIASLKKVMACKMKLVPELVPLSAFAGRKAYLHFLIEDLSLDVHSRDENNKTAFLRAAEGGQKTILEYLLPHGVNWDDIDKRHRNVFHLAVEGGSFEVVEYLIKKCNEFSGNKLKLLLDAKDIYIGTELCFLIRGKDKGRPAWHYVEVRRNVVSMFTTKTKSGSVDVAQYGTVIKSGWGTDPEDSVMEELEDRLKQRGEQNQPEDMTPLHLACFKEEVSIATALLEHGADPNSKDSFGLTPLHLACMKGNMQLVEVLEKHSADSSVIANDGTTPLQVAEDNGHSKIINCIQGRRFLSRAEAFVGRINYQIRLFHHDYLEKLRSEGKDIRRHLIDSLRDISMEINQVLYDIGSGPVVEETSHSAY